MFSIFPQTISMYSQWKASAPAVYEMLSVMKAKLDASRSLLYETTRFVDMYKTYEDIARERSLTPDERAEMKKYSRLADAFTPLVKGMGSEIGRASCRERV